MGHASSFPTLGVVCGLALEAALLPPGVRTLCLGPGPRAAAIAARRLLAEGCGALVSFGTAGGLDPALPPGTLLLPTAVVRAEPLESPASADESGPPALFPVADALLAALRAQGLAANHGLLAGVDDPVTTPDAKAALTRATGACAVDMESHAIAAVAHAARRPFLVVRAVADPADRGIPAWALKGVDAEGATRAIPVLAAVVARPTRIPALIALARDAGCARETLTHAGHFLAALASGSSEG
ncbi:phosphorylase family protein [Pararhodospirillum oryzae]|uniref:Purine phosphorylase n=1 Tax=Pararhodospirillum oryzae TaxID=478448 RepID=A0A512H9S8_9PROT|nr:purine phosphorylase [Pararhodospirillum oryzae]GEO82140.1 purine phosphorylase [Pararhodospirillum oryzae]